MKSRLAPTFDPTLTHLVGGDFVRRLTETDRARAPLRIGSQVWSTHDLATKLGVVHTRAARNVTVAAASIGAKNVADFYRRSSPMTFAPIKGFGETTLYVLWRVFQSAGLDPDAWSSEADVSFRALKHRAARREKEDRSDATSQNHIRRTRAPRRLA